MCFKRKKKEEVEEVVEVVKTNSDLPKLVTQIDVLLTINEDESVKNALLELKEFVKYSNPSQNKNAYEYEMSVVKKLDNVKLLSLATKDIVAILAAIKEAKVMMAERNSAC